MEAMHAATIRVSLKNDRAHVIVENLGRDAAEEPQRVLVTGYERLDLLVIAELDVGSPAPERGYEHLQLDGTAPNTRPVRLQLPARRCLESYDWLRRSSRHQTAHELLHPRLAADIATIAKFAEQHGRRNTIRCCRRRSSHMWAMIRVKGHGRAGVAFSIPRRALIIRKQIKTLAVATALAFTTSVLAPQAEAHWRGGHGWHGGGIALGILGGLFLGSALAHGGHHYGYGPYYGYSRGPHYGHPHYHYGQRHHRHRHHDRHR